jgi:hypothetical protein
MPLIGAAVLTALLAILALAGGRDGGSSQGAPATGSAAPVASRRAVLLPAVGDPFRVRGSRFRAHERVRVTVTPSTGHAITRRVRATGRGTFVLAFAGVEPCRGVEGVAAGSRGSHASFQFSSFTC